MRGGCWRRCMRPRGRRRRPSSWVRRQVTRYGGFGCAAALARGLHAWRGATGWRSASVGLCGVGEGRRGALCGDACTSAVGVGRCHRGCVGRPRDTVAADARPRWRAVSTHGVELRVAIGFGGAGRRWRGPAWRLFAVMHAHPRSASAGVIAGASAGDGMGWLRMRGRAGARSPRMAWSYGGDRLRWGRAALARAGAVSCAP
jgi:hypothetical protein